MIPSTITPPIHTPPRISSFRFVLSFWRGPLSLPSAPGLVAELSPRLLSTVSTATLMTRSVFSGRLSAAVLHA